MKIAVVTFANNFKKPGGTVTGPVYFREMLNEIEGVSSDVIVVGEQKSYSGYTDIVKFTGWDEADIANILNQYEFLIFAQPGFDHEDVVSEDVGHHYDYLLNNIKVPFTFVVNEERDREIYPCVSEFYNHPYCKFILFNSVDMHLDFEDYTSQCHDWIEFNYYLKLPELSDVIKMFSEKPEVLMSTARWTSRKRQRELAELAPQIKEAGISVKLAGLQLPYFYAATVYDVNPDSWENLGAYNPDDLPVLFSQCKYHYNFVYRKRKNKNIIMRDRLEIATFEAVKYGCLPIICLDTSPKWLAEDDGICLESKDLKRLPEILSNMTEQEAIRRLTNFYEHVDNKFRNNYKMIVNKISEVLDEQ